MELLENKTFNYIIYSICLLVMVILLAVTIFKLFVLGSRQDKLEYLKNYKRGSFMIIYLVAIPLYFFGYVNCAALAGNGIDVLTCFLNSITASVNLILLNFGIAGIRAALTTDNLLYCIAIGVCFSLTVLNVILFSVSLLWQRFKNLCGCIRARCARHLVVVVGNNENNLLLCSSLKKSADKHTRGILLVKPDDALRDRLYLDGIPYISLDSEKGECVDLLGRLSSLLGLRFLLHMPVKKNVSVIINTTSDERNLLYLEQADKLLHKKITYRAEVKKDGEQPTKAEKSEEDKKKRENVCDQLIKVPVNAVHSLVMIYSFYKLDNKTAFRVLEDGSLGHIRLLNEQERVAVDFVDKYPLTKFMTGEQIDYAKGLVKDVDINVCLVGFGAINQRLFIKLVSDSQFYTEGDGGLIHKKVHYHAFDRDKTYNDKNLNQTYFRYSREFYKQYIKDKDDYLPLPDYPADDWYYFDDKTEPGQSSEQFLKHFHEVDIDSYEFFDELRTSLVGKNPFNYIIVSFGDDMENIDLAKKISARLGIWGLAANTHIFAKVKSAKLALSLSGESREITPFGVMRDVYDVIKIIDDPIKQLAFLKSFTYDRGNGGMSVNARMQAAVNKWMGSSLTQKDGNYNSCLNLRTKLNLLGFDYVEKSAEACDATQQFLMQYFELGEVDLEEKADELRYDVHGELAAKYKDSSARTTLAIQEHQRWNAYYICCGIVPPPKSAITKLKDGKDLVNLMVHCNLTTFEGLEECISYTHREVRKYDYRAVDFADRLLTDAGYKIVRKEG
ncbi:MAG: hypothetical protein ACI4QI_05230 [Candidatus Coproplasma sp.]